MRYYTLGPNHELIRTDDPFEWSFWCMTNDRKVAESYVCGFWVSTVFLGLDHGFAGTRLLFETMVFDEGSTIRCDRCETWEQAEAMHARIVAEIDTAGVKAMIACDRERAV